MKLSFQTGKTALLLCFIVAIQACVSGNKASHHKNDTAIKYIPVEHPMLEVQNTLDTAKKSNKLALIVMGAQWCHDSTGLVDKFETDDMQSLLKQHYETVFIDVGYFEDRRDITQRFGQAHYFATPTVLVVDPTTEQLLNSKSIQKWGKADSVPLYEYINYFSGFNDVSQFAPKPISPVHAQQIAKFKQQQSQRLMDAYIVLRPDLKKDVERPAGSPYSELFIERWNEVKAFRLQLQKDIQQLTLHAQQNSKVNLVLPVYAKFTWE